ncbi:MAG: SEC-C domain-containing protein [Imperialibacter sp.]|uniref:YecA family protein n=1 Tax=Imperialibacter sp. TaxID=2038411 RepID=UPI0032ECA406
MTRKILKALLSDIDKVVLKYPEVEPIMSGRTPVGLEGIIDIHDSDGLNRGSFQIRVGNFQNYPNSFPSLRELSRLIPRIEDRHVYGDGNCCVTVLQMQLIEARRGILLSRYFSQYVVPYLANQIHYEEYGEWANEEYMHGFSGQIQFYVEELKMKDFQTLYRAFEIALGRIRISRNDKCFCHSGLKYKQCHIGSIGQMILIGNTQLREDLTKLNLLLLENRLSKSNKK